MTKKIFFVFAAVLMLTACNKPVSDEQLEKAIAKYIEENPETVIASLRKASQKGGQKQGERPQADAAALKKVQETILSDSHHAIIGDINSKNVVIEFYDYNCGYCKRALDTVMKLANADKAKVVLVELPVLGPASHYAAKASAVVQDIEPGKHLAFYREMMNAQGHVDENGVAEIIKKIGVDSGVFQKAMQDKKYDEMLAKNTQVARSVGISGTPSFIVNGQLIRGAVPYETFKSALK